MKSKTPSDVSREQCLADWYLSPQGGEVLDILRTELTDLLSTRFGYLGVQVGGGPLQPPLVASSRVNQSAVISALHVDGVVQASPLALPVASESADLVMLVHALEHASDPYQLLRELDRILVPEGDAVLISFNPWSLWGVWSWLSGKVWRENYAPWQGRFYATRRIKDWLNLLGFEMVAVRRLIYRPPFCRGWLGQRLGWMDKIGPRVLPLVGGLQVIVARKRRTRLTLIKPRWRQVPVMSATVPKNALRSVSRDGD